MKRLLIALIFLSAGSIGAIPGYTPPPDPLPDLVEKISPGVVNISAVTLVKAPAGGMEDFLRFWGIPTERKQSSLGSGVLIDKDGLVVTNNHVIAQATEVMVTLNDRREFRARLIGRDPKLDIALLQIRTNDRKVPENLAPVSAGDSDKVRIAQAVLAIGNPFGLQNTVTRGIISAQHRTIGIGPFDNFLQTDASINPGNSGGPLFNMAGEVIGINTVIFSKTGQSAGLGFAIPINSVKKVLPDLIKYGRVPRPWLGVATERMTAQIMAYYQLPRAEGVLIYNVVEGAPGDRAGLRSGDIVVQVDGAKTLDPNDVERELVKLKPDGVLTLKIQRGRKLVDVKVKLAELPPKIENLPQGII